MSIIEQSSKLNLIGKIAFVTNASSPLGAVICRTLLAHNARVLGIDNAPIHPSLNAAAGTHMQFYQCDVSSGGNVAEDIVQAARVKFDGAEHMSLLVDIDQSIEKLAGTIVKTMAAQGGGMVLSTSVGEIRKLAKSSKDEGVRFNAIVSDEAADQEAAQKESIFDKNAYEAARNLKGAHDSTDEHIRARGIANLILFLTSKHSEGIDRQVVRVDGSCQPL